MPKPQHSPIITEGDRLSFTFFVAIAAHAVIILGVGFTAMSQSSPSSLIEVTLTQFKNDSQPKKADFIALHNQQGSGTLNEKAELSAEYKAIYQDNVIKHIQLKKPTVTRSDPKKLTKLIQSHGTSLYKQTSQESKKSLQDPKLKKAKNVQLHKRNMEIASLEAKLNKLKQIQAKGPKTRQITSVSAKSSEEAAYVNSFREKIEYIGNKYYPHEAKTKEIYGNVRLLVALKKDGNIQEIKVIESSNQAILDRAAINSIRLAAPFPRFPKSIRKNTDILEIIRTWRFEKHTVRTSS